MPKFQVSSVGRSRPLESSIYLFLWFVFFFLCNAALLFVSLFMIGILLLRPYESMETPDSYSNQDDSIKIQTKSKDSLSKNHWIITYWMINIMTQNPKKVFYLDQNKTGGVKNKRKVFWFITLWKFFWNPVTGCEY